MSESEGFERFWWELVTDHLIARAQRPWPCPCARLPVVVQGQEYEQKLSRWEQEREPNFREEELDFARELQGWETLRGPQGRRELLEEHFPEPSPSSRGRSTKFFVTKDEKRWAGRFLDHVRAEGPEHVKEVLAGKRVTLFSYDLNFAAEDQRLPFLDLPALEPAFENLENDHALLYEFGLVDDPDPELEDYRQPEFLSMYLVQARLFYDHLPLVYDVPILTMESVQRALDLLPDVCARSEAEWERDRSGRAAALLARLVGASRETMRKERPDQLESESTETLLDRVRTFIHNMVRLGGNTETEDLDLDRVAGERDLEEKEREVEEEKIREIAEESGYTVEEYKERLRDVGSGEGFGFHPGSPGDSDWGT